MPGFRAAAGDSRPASSRVFLGPEAQCATCLHWHWRTRTEVLPPPGRTPSRSCYPRGGQQGMHTCQLLASRRAGTPWPVAGPAVTPAAYARHVLAADHGSFLYLQSTRRRAALVAWCRAMLTGCCGDTLVTCKPSWHHMPEQASSGGRPAEDHTTSHAHQSGPRGSNSPLAQRRTPSINKAGALGMASNTSNISFRSAGPPDSEQGRHRAASCQPRCWVQRRPAATSAANSPLQPHGRLPPGCLAPRAPLPPALHAAAGRSAQGGASCPSARPTCVGVLHAARLGGDAADGRQLPPDCVHSG